MKKAECDYIVSLSDGSELQKEVKDDRLRQERKLISSGLQTEEQIEAMKNLTDVEFFQEIQMKMKAIINMGEATIRILKPFCERR